MRNLKPLVKTIVLTSMAILCAGCKSCGTDRPRSMDPSPDNGAPSETAVAVPEPPEPETSARFDQRPVAAAPTIAELNEQAHASGLLVEVFFDFDRADLGSEARSALQHNARYLRREGAVRLTIEGHCDERGTHEYNLALGQLRAGAARDYLVRLGIEPDRLGTVSYGEHEGLCFDSNEGCWARNRRAYFRISGRSPERITGRLPSGSRPRAGS